MNASRTPSTTGTATSPEPELIALHEHFMRMALREALRAFDDGEVPTGCVIVDLASAPAGPGRSPFGFRVLGRASNQTERLRDPTAHAEMIAITQAASARGDWRLTDTALYVTKEPCAMCAGAIVLARIPTVIFGVADAQRGGACSVFNILRHPALNHRADVLGGILESECRTVLRQFFKTRRADRRDRPARDGHNHAARVAPSESDSAIHGD